MLFICFITLSSYFGNSISITVPLTYFKQIPGCFLIHWKQIILFFNLTLTDDICHRILWNMELLNITAYAKKNNLLY